MTSVNSNNEWLSSPFIVGSRVVTDLVTFRFPIPISKPRTTVLHEVLHKETRIQTKFKLFLGFFVMVKKIVLVVTMKNRRTVQRQLNLQPASFSVLMALVFQRRKSVITSRTATTAWMKRTALVLTSHNGVARGQLNVFLSVTSVTEQWNVPMERMKRVVPQFYQQQLLQRCRVLQPQCNRLQITPLLL